LTEKAKKDAFKFNYPLLMCLGSMDFIQPHEEAEEFVENTSTKDREVIVFEHGYHQLYNDVKVDVMFDYIHGWMKDSKRNQVPWNSGKVGSIKSDFLKAKNYVRKLIFMLIGGLVALYMLVKKLRKCWKGCTSL
jgi:hypothetical protein